MKNLTLRSAYLLCTKKQENPGKRIKPPHFRLPSIMKRLLPGFLVLFFTAYSLSAQPHTVPPPPLNSDTNQFRVGEEAERSLQQRTRFRRLNTGLEEKSQVFLVLSTGGEIVQYFPLNFDENARFSSDNTNPRATWTASTYPMETNAWPDFSFNKKAVLLPLNIPPFYGQQRWLLLLLLLLTAGLGYGVYKNRTNQLATIITLRQLETSVGQKISRQQIVGLLNDFRAQKTKKIALPTNEGMVFLRLEDIVRLESSGNYTFFYTTEGERMIVSQTIKNFEKTLLAEHFFRLHQSHIVNLQYVRQILREDGCCYILTEDQAKIPISRRKKEAFLQLLTQQVL